MTPRILIIDIERQSALVDGVWDCRKKRYIHPNQVIEPARTICFAYKWADEDEIHFVAEWHYSGYQNNRSYAPGGGHKKMIREAHRLLDEADYVVGWNSKAFDVKQLRGSIWAYGITPPSPHVDIDLMLQVNQNFDLMSSRLGHVAEKVKQLEEGKLDPSDDLWRTLRFGKGEELVEARAEMAEYNMRDVQVTGEIYEGMLPWIKGMNVAMFVDDDDPRCVSCKSDNLERRGWAPARNYLYRRYRCKKCGKWNKGRRREYGSVLVSA